jgi:hypothetical protein
MKQAVVFLASLLIASSAQAADWKAYQYLIGAWTGSGNGVPGPSTGTDSFTMDLQNQVIVRKSHSDYPALNGRAAFTQDSMMVIYRDAAGEVKANYFDNENHVINYSATVSNNAWIFLSSPSASMPQFRLTYTLQDDKTMNVLFELSAPGLSSKFQTYVSGTDIRQ